MDYHAIPGLYHTRSLQITGTFYLNHTNTAGTKFMDPFQIAQGRNMNMI